MLNKLWSDSFRRGIDILTEGCISGFGIVIGGISDLGVDVGSDGEDDIDSKLVWSEDVDADGSFFDSDFF